NTHSASSFSRRFGRIPVCAARRANAADRLRSCRKAACSARTRRLQFRDPPESPPPPSLKSHRQLPPRNAARDSSYICHPAHCSAIVQRNSYKGSAITAGFYSCLQKPQCCKLFPISDGFYERLQNPELVDSGRALREVFLSPMAFSYRESESAKP